MLINKHLKIKMSENKTFSMKLGELYKEYPNYFYSYFAVLFVVIIGLIVGIILASKSCKNNNTSKFGSFKDSWEKVKEGTKEAGKTLVGKSNFGASGKLSTGAIVGIVIGSIGALVLIVGIFTGAIPLEKLLLGK